MQRNAAPATTTVISPHNQIRARPRVRRATGLAVLLSAALAVSPSALEAAPRLPVGDEELVWVRFADRGPLAHASVADRRAAALSQISERSLKRRARSGITGDVLETDLPVYAGYINELRDRGIPIRAVSRWLNGVSVVADPQLLNEIAALSFVRGLSDVQHYTAPTYDESDFELRTDAEGGLPRVPSPEYSPLEEVLVPGDSLYYAGSWAQHRVIQTDKFQGLGYSGEGILIAILDTGFRETHEVFDSLSVIARRDFIYGDSVVSNQPGQDNDPGEPPFTNQESHGTYVLSILGGFFPGRHVGTAPRADYALAKTEFLNTETVVEMDWWQMAIEWADSLGADVVSSSLGYVGFDDPDPSYTYSDMDGRTTVVALAAVEAARRGILVVNSQGNNGNSVSYPYMVSPADADSLCAVGGVDSLSMENSFSAEGPTSDGRTKPDVCGMGSSVHIASATNDNSYVRFSGTSFSAPAVAGLSAMLLEAHPSWGAFDVLTALRATASQAQTPDNKLGFGVAQACLANEWNPGAVDVSSRTGRGGLQLVGQYPRQGATELRFKMGPKGGTAKLEVFDARGRRLGTLFDGEVPARQSRVVSWDGSLGSGGNLAAGIYIVRFSAPGVMDSRRVVHLP